MLKPVLHRVLVKPDDVETVSKGGIVIAVDPKKERVAVETGHVLAIGDTAFKDYQKSPVDFTPVVGNRVYYAKYAGKIVKDTDDKEYLILNDEDIIAVVE